MLVENTLLPGCLLITSPRFEDERGYFCVSYNQKVLAEAGFTVEFVQDNQSLSKTTGTLRGLHYQAPPFAQDKLVRVIKGRVLDVVVDVRQGSPTYCQHIAVELSAENGRQLLIPKGFLHGFLTLAPDTEFFYKVSNSYAAASDGSVRFDDPELAIDWGLQDAPVLSAKDKEAPAFKDWNNPFIYGVNS